MKDLGSCENVAYTIISTFSFIISTGRPARIDFQY